MKTLKEEIRKELACRTDPVFVATLVESYGPEVKGLLKEMRRAGEARLIASGCGYTAAAYYHEVDEAWLRAGSIEGANEWFILVEAA